MDNKEKVLINMVDGSLISVNYGESMCLDAGCPNCGYGGHWIEKINIEMVNCNIEVTTGTMYGWDVIEEERLIATFTSNISEIEKMTEREFAKWLKEELKNWVDRKYQDDIEVKLYERI